MADPEVGLFRRRRYYREVSASFVVSYIYYVLKLSEKVGHLSRNYPTHFQENEEMTTNIYIGEVQYDICSVQYFENRCKVKVYVKSGKNSVKSI